MASSSWHGAAGGDAESAPSTPERRSGDQAGGDTGFIKHKVLKTDNLAGIAIKYRASVADIKRLNALASDTAIFAREHVLVPTRPLAPPGADRAQVALARLMSGYPPQGERRRGGGGGGGGGSHWDGGGGGGPGGCSTSMRSGASTRTAGGGGGGGGGGLPALHWGVGGGGGLFDANGDGDEGDGSGTPYSRRSDKTVSEPGDVELMDRGAGGGGGNGSGASGGGIGGAAAALADRLSRRRLGGASSPAAAALGPSPSAPNLGAMLHRLGAASTGAAESAMGWFGGGAVGGGGSGAAAAAGGGGGGAAMLPPLPRRASTSSAAGQGALLVRQLSTAFGSTVDALARVASQPVLLPLSPRGGGGGGSGGGGKDD